LLAVADETELHFRTWFAASYFRDQIIALGDFLAVQSRNGVANLQSGLVCGTSRYDAGNRDAGTRSVDASNGRILLRVKHNADGAARDPVLGSGQLVLAREDGVGRHREADAGIGVGFAKDGSVDADALPRHVDQRST